MGDSAAPLSGRSVAKQQTSSCVNMSNTFAFASLLDHVQHAIRIAKDEMEKERRPGDDLLVQGRPDQGEDVGVRGHDGLDHQLRVSNGLNAI